MKKKYIDNPELKNQLSIKQKEVMNSPEIKSKIKEGLKNSEKWNIIKNKNKKIQIKNHTEEEKNKLKQITTDYFNSNENIIKHRETMSYLVGLHLFSFKTPTLYR
jgi:hypothetical protein